MKNTHWPEPIVVDNEEDVHGAFIIIDIFNHADKSDVAEQELLLEDDEGYSVLQRTAYRLEQTYNASAGLKIDQETNLRELTDLQCQCWTEDRSRNQPA